MSQQIIQIFLGKYWIFLHVFPVSAVMALLFSLPGSLQAAVRQERFPFPLHLHWLERWPASGHSQLFQTSNVTSPTYQTAQQLVTTLGSLTETTQTRFAEILWVLLTEMALLLAAEEELKRQAIIIRKRLRMNIWGWPGIGDFCHGHGEKKWAVCLLPKLQLELHFKLQLTGNMYIPL